MDFFDEAGRFKTPELAALHAVVIQGGFSTPRIEAERMLRDGERRGDPVLIARARLWLDEDDAATSAGEP